MFICFHLDLPELALQKLPLLSKVATFYKNFPLPLISHIPIGLTISHTFLPKFVALKFN